MDATTGKPLKVLIVGAGLGGLMAAVGLRSQGHEVTLLERSELAQETGAAVHIAPNAHGLLRRFGILPETFGANPVKRVVEYEQDGSIMTEVDAERMAPMWQHQWVLSHRVALHNELKRVATSSEGQGVPAILRTSHKVSAVDPQNGTITLEDGSTISGDLVLGADGVSSITRGAVAGDIKPFSSGKSAFRFLIPHEDIRNNPVTKYLTEKEGIMYIWFGVDRRVVMYPCNNNTMMNFVAIHPSEESAPRGDDWSTGTTKEALLSTYMGFPSVVPTLFEMADSSSLKAWTLLDMERIPRWTNGKLALLGDAAHPFLPHQGQGAGIAIEDAVCLTAVLPLGTLPADIPDRLALYEKIRDERAHKIQYISRIIGGDIDEKSRESFDMFGYVQYNYGHDEWHNSSHQFKKWLWSRNGPAYFRQPISFGPLVSPRQDHYGAPISAQESTLLVHTIRFKTSATYLKTLFPSASFSFAGPGTVVEASYVCTQLGNLKWLGNTGYNFFGLWIHGVKYTKKDGTELHGSFLPILFESLGDPIVTGREELGMPKLYADVQVKSTENSTEITCGWQGTQFVNIKLDKPKEATNEPVNGSHPRGPPPIPETGLFVWRSVPTVGRPGEMDAEYPVFIGNGQIVSPKRMESTRHWTTPQVKIDAGDWNSLPTIHQISSTLAEVPIYSIVEAKTETGFGAMNFSSIGRIE